MLGTGPREIVEKLREARQQKPGGGVELFSENGGPQRTQEKRLMLTQFRRINDQDMSFQIEAEFGRVKKGVHLPSTVNFIRCVQNWLGEP